LSRDHGAAIEIITKITKNLPENQPADLARELVRMPTENPPGDEARAVEFLAEFLGDWGFETEVLRTDQGRLNLIARTGWGRRSPTILLNGHLDVVPAGDESAWTVPPYDGFIQDGKLYGRGAADMKGGVAALLWAARLIQTSSDKPADGEIVVHLVSDEETGGAQGAKFLVDQGLAVADAAIVGEPTRLEVVIACKGAVWTRLTTRGKSAHGSVPHLGDNAIERMAEFFVKLREVPKAGEHHLLGPPTMNLGTISGGSKINVVPDRCSVEIDQRVLPGTGLEQARAGLKNLIEKHVAETGTEVDLEEILYAAPYEIDPAEPIVRIALETAAEVTGKPKEPKGAKGFTDARFYVLEAGIPTIILGPGSITQAHTADEFIGIEQLRQAVGLYGLIITRFLSS
jgi:acetylornithine deacetylase/succinyl-diaminopimelate desuccinylase family protein